jgi:hypothetical protein
MVVKDRNKTLTQENITMETKKKPALIGAQHLR